MDKKISILIVDDDEGMTETMSDIFLDMGYDVDIAGDGYNAIEHVKKKVFDVILMDIKMPGINGVETFKKIKKISPSSKVMMMTAYSVEELIKEALDEGAYFVFHKPLDIENLSNIIKKAQNGSLILVVDDDPDMCESIKDTLEDEGYKVGVAHSGPEAISSVKEKKYDIIFIDIKMPVLNGLETFLALKEINPDIYAIMMTGFKQEVSELVDQALKNDAYTCLYKPLDMDNVLSVVNQISNKKVGDS